MPNWLGRGLAAALLLLTSVTAQAGEPLRVASFNLRLNLASDAPNDWPSRRAQVLALIQHHDWDLFGTQEALPDQVADLEQLPGYLRVGVGRDDGASRGEHAAVFIRTTRLELRRQGTFWLSETPERPSKGWDARCCHRIVTWVELRDRRAPEAGSFYLFNTHFDHEGGVARRESAKLLLSRWKALAGDAPTLMVGDFNAGPGSEPVQLLRTALRDARETSRTLPYGPEGTFQGFRIDAPLTAQDRIDHIFHTPGIEVLSWAALTDSRQGRFPSDHLPVQAVVRLP